MYSQTSKINIVRLILVKNIIEDLPSSMIILRLLMNGWKKNKLLKLESINSLTLALKSLNTTTQLTLCQRCMELNKLNYYQKIILKILLTGWIKAPSPLSKTKDNAVHAGLSLPLVPLKVPNSFMVLENLSVYLNNNLLIVLGAAGATRAAKVV